jgi:hypothetical protein
MTEHLRMGQPLRVRTAVFIGFVHYRFYTVFSYGAASQTERDALIHYHFIYEYINGTRKRHAYVIEDLFSLPLFI